MSLSQMKADLHDRLWNAQQRWFDMQDEGPISKYGIKMAGVRDFRDQNHYMRPILFTGRTRTTYERVLKGFLDFAHAKFGVERLDNIDTKHAKAFLDDSIQRGLAAKTLHMHRSALAKIFACIGKTESGAALSRKYGAKIRELVAAGAIAGPKRSTPSREAVERAIEVLREWDERAGKRAYHLAARLQLESGARSISVTARLTKASLKGPYVIECKGKGGQLISTSVSPGLYDAISDHLDKAGEPLADLRGYQAAWRRAIQAAEGRVTGTHGLRRLSTQQFYRSEYARLLTSGVSPDDARRVAREAAVERLGHSRDRIDQANCYLGPAA
ncbi:MAG: site-specific integrase [Planctomycetes bacterium]|nr:site-specific integrase [Planctomycetota bacterium]